MSNKHNRDKGAATTARQSKKKTNPVVETATETPIDMFAADMSMLKSKLVEIAKSAGVDTKGTKQELIDRITA